MKRADIAVRPQQALQGLFLTKAFAALCNDDAIGLLFKAFHSGFCASRGLDRLRLSVPSQFDHVALRSTFERLRAVQIGDLDRVFVTLLRDVQVGTLNSGPASDKCVDRRRVCRGTRRG